MTPPYPRTGPRSESLEARIAAIRATQTGRPHLDPAAPKPVWLRGIACPTAADVIATYQPTPRSSITPEQWAEAADFIRASVTRAKPRTPSTAHTMMQTVCHYVAWALTNEVPLRAEQIFTPARVEHYCATAIAHRSSRTISTVRGALRSVGLATTKKAPWQPPTPQLRKYAHVAAPYTPNEVENLLACAANQGTPRRVHVMTCIITLGLGAGLSPWEMFELTADDVIDDPTLDVMLVVLPSRVIPVRPEHRERLRAIMRAYPTGRLSNEPGRRAAQDPLGARRVGLQVPERLRPFTAARLKTTWSVNELNDGIPLPQFLYTASTLTGQNLAYYTPYLADVSSDLSWVHRRSQA